MKITIVGSRDYPQTSYGLLWNYLQALPKDTVVISGHARGIDLQAELWARDTFHLAVEIHPADWQRYGKAAGFLRNRDMVESADRVVAFWDGKSKGTQHSIKLARELGKPLQIHYPDGRVEIFDESQAILF